MLLIPRKQILTQQPQGVAQIDWSNPITQDLSFALDRGRDAVSGKLATLNGQTLNASKNGIGLTSTTGAAATFGTGLFATSNGAGTGDFSFAVFANPSASATRTIVLGALWGANPEPYFTFNGNGLDSNSSGRIAFGWNSSPRSYIESQSTSIVDGKWHLFSATRVNGVMFLVVDGVEVAHNKANNSANLYKDTAITSIGGYSSSGYGLNGACVPFLAVANRAWSIGEHKSLFDNPWQIFRAPDSRIFVPTGYGAPAGADLTGNAQAQATATGNLTLKADLDAVALSVATASGNLTTFIPLTGAAVAIGSASGALTSGIKLSAAATASALSSGSLVAQIKLNGAALAQAAASAGLTSAILLAGIGQGQATASGTLAADPGSMASNAQAQATAVATLTTSIRLSGAAAAQAGVGGILTTNISLTAAALAQAIATGTLAVPILLAGTAHGVATATGNLTAPDSATAVYFRLASSVQRLTKAACTAQRLTTIKHEVQHV